MRDMGTGMPRDIFLSLDFQPFYFLPLRFFCTSKSSRTFFALNLASAFFGLGFFWAWVIFYIANVDTNLTLVS